MRILMHFGSVAVTPAAIAAAEDILQRTLSRVRDRVPRVELFVVDTNGERGGVDKQCRLLVHLRGQSTVVISDRDERVSTLVQRAAARAAHVIRERLQRSARKERTSIRHRER